MQLIIGLGNPGDRYINTRHNVGFQITDVLRSVANGNAWQEEKKLYALISKLPTADILLAKPTTFMNESGVAVSKIVNFFKIKHDDVYIIHDDLDIKLGEYKIQLGVGPKNHNGLLSIYEKLATQNFWHVRVGIDNRCKNNELRIPGEEYVLQSFGSGEYKILNAITEKVVEDLSKRVVD